MSEMIERVARAIFPEAYIGAGFEGGWDEWESAMARTRLGIEAMREPTEAMLEAVEMLKYGDPAEAYAVDVRALYHAMIDVALSE